MTRVGASPAEWHHLDLILGLGPDLLPIVADPDAGVRPGSSLDGKIGKVPSLFDRHGMAMGFTNWTAHSASDAELLSWASEPRFGIGVQTRGDVAAIDLDLEDGALVERVADRIAACLGTRLPARSRANSPRCLLVCRVAGSRKKVIIPTDSGRIEILGEGQQFVAGGMHPSGAHYRWDGDGPNGLPAFIPTVSSALFDACIADLRAEFGTKRLLSMPAKPETSDDLDALVSDETLADLDDAMMYLASVGYGREYDDWVWAGNMLKSLGETVRDVFLRYSSELGNEKPGEAEAKWPQLRADRAGYRAIFTKAQGLGWVNPRKAPTSESVVERLRQMSREDILREWAPLAATMPKDRAADVLSAVHQLTAIGKRDLSNRLKDARRDLNRQRRRDAVGSRKLLVYQPENSVAQAAEVGALILASAPPGALVNHAGRPARIVEAYQPNAHQIDDVEAPPPLTMVVEGHSQASLRAEVENVAVFHVVREADMVPVAVPVLTLEALLELDAAQAPPISGVLLHPIVRLDGSILAADGIDSRTGLFAHGITGGETLRPYSQQEAESARVWLENEALVGFEFASKLNAHIALAGLLTAVQRRLMDTAPGLAILAPAQASGKTTLARRFHLFLTGRDMPVVTLPVGSDPEIGKLLLSLLQSSPPMICFDNISDGLVVHGGPLNAAMTSPTFEGRILGSTKTLTVPTNTFFVVTGNNLRLGSDEVTRLLTTTLAPTHARPEQRRFSRPDVVAHALSIRDRLLREVVGIVAGYLTSGDHLPLPTGSRFSRWDRMVRQPLVWAGADDVAKSFEINGSEAEHVQALRSLLLALHEEFSGDRFSARQVCDLVGHFDQTKAYRVHDALEALAVRDPRSPRSVGKALQGCLNRVVEVDGATLSLRASIDRNGTRAYTVTKCGVCGV